MAKKATLDANTRKSKGVNSVLNSTLSRFSSQAGTHEDGIILPADKNLNQVEG